MESHKIQNIKIPPNLLWLVLLGKVVIKCRLNKIFLFFGGMFARRSLKVNTHVVGWRRDALSGGVFQKLIWPGLCLQLGDGGGSLNLLLSLTFHQHFNNLRSYPGRHILKTSLLEIIYADQNFETIIWFWFVTHDHHNELRDVSLNPLSSIWSGTVIQRLVLEGCCCTGAACTLSSSPSPYTFAFW